MVSSRAGIDTVARAVPADAGVAREMRRGDNGAAPSSAMISLTPPVTGPRITPTAMIRLATILSLACVLGWSIAVPVRAFETAPVANQRGVATLIGDRDSVVAGGRVRIAFRLRLAEGWHTYWQNPGEAGVPVELDPTLSAGATAGPIEWPAPEKISEGTVTTYGYSGEVILPINVALNQGIASVSGDVTAHWLACKDICVPEEATFHVDVPSGPGTPSAQAPLFQAHDQIVPRPSPWKATIAQDGTLYVRGEGLGAATVVDAWFIPDAPGEIVDGAAQLLSVRDGGFTLGLRLAHGFAIDNGLKGVLSVRDRGGMQADIALAARPGPAPGPVVPLARALIFAFLGGLILNLMPCVFPILAMKAVGFASGLARGRARAHAVAYTAGVLATFSVRGGRATGRALGGARRRAGDFSSPRPYLSPRWPGCCSPWD